MARKRGPKGQFIKKKKTSSKKAQVLAKTKSLQKKSLAQIQREQKMRPDKSPTRTINMHGSNYTLYDSKPRTKSEAQKVRQKLKSQGKAAFINPRKRKAGIQWFIYQKPSKHAQKKVGKPTKVKVSKRTGVPTGSINMHGKRYNIHDNKPRTKSEAQVVRKKLIGQGKAAFLNPRKRKSGTEYFVYQKPAERRLKVNSKPSKPRKKAGKSRAQIIKELESDLRKLKARD